MPAKRARPRFRWVFPDFPMQSFSGRRLTFRDRAIFLTTITTLFVTIGVISTIFPPRRTVVDGKEVVDIMVAGHVMPLWVFVPVALAALLLFNSAVHYAFAWIWPDPNVATEKQPEGEWVTLDDARPMKGGGIVGWVSDEPDGWSPMDYTPPVFSPDTTAEEFLFAVPPNPMRSLLAGVDSMHEQIEFDELKEAWLEVAPEITLRDLLGVAEKVLAEDQSGESRIPWDLLEANRIRGIPTIDELLALADRVDHENLRSSLKEIKTDRS